MPTDLERPGKIDLLALRQETPTRMGARMFVLLPEVESALAEGFTRHAIHNALVASGLQIGFLGFVKSLYRARKKLRSLPSLSASSPAHSPPPKPRPAPPQQPASDPPPKVPVPATHTSSSSWKPGSIAEIARSQPDMAGLAKKGREYAAKLAAEKKLKAEKAKLSDSVK
jgi:hypothetical protein